MAIRGVLNLKMACLLSRTRSLSHTTRPPRSAHLSATSAEDTPAEPFPPQRFRNKHKRSRNPITRSKGNKKNRERTTSTISRELHCRRARSSSGTRERMTGGGKIKRRKGGNSGHNAARIPEPEESFLWNTEEHPPSTFPLCPLLPHCPLEGAGGRWFVHELRLEQKSIGDSLQSRTHERVKTYGSTNPPE